MKSLSYTTFLITFLCSLTSAYADDCTAALVRKEIHSSNDNIVKISIASLITEETYDKHKEDFGVNVPIQGVPVGANYNEFHKNINKALSKYKLDEFQSYSESYASSGLDQNSRDAYIQCKLLSGGLDITTGEVRRDSSDIVITYVPFKNQTKGIKGHLTNTQNIEPKSESALREKIENADYDIGLSGSASLVPIKRELPMTIDVSVGVGVFKTITIAPIPRPHITEFRIASTIEEHYVEEQGQPLKVTQCAYTDRPDAIIKDGSWDLLDKDLELITAGTIEHEWQPVQSNRICLLRIITNTVGGHINVGFKGGIEAIEEVVSFD